MCVFVKTRVQKRVERARERERRSWCVTGVGWEGLKKHHKHWPLTSLWDWWGCDLSIIYLQQTHKTHKHTHTPHRITHAAIPAGEASDCAMSAAMAVFEFSLLPNMCDGARLKTDPESPLTYGQIEKRQRNVCIQSCVWQNITNRKQRERKKEMRFFLYSYIFILNLVA